MILQSPRWPGVSIGLALDVARAARCSCSGGVFTASSWRAAEGLDVPQPAAGLAALEGAARRCDSGSQAGRVPGQSLPPSSTNAWRSSFSQVTWIT